MENSYSYFHTYSLWTSFLWFLQISLAHQFSWFFLCGRGQCHMSVCRAGSDWLGYAPCDQVPAHRPERMSNVLLYHPPSLNLGFAFSARLLFSLEVQVISCLWPLSTRVTDAHEPSQLLQECRGSELESTRLCGNHRYPPSHLPNPIQHANFQFCILTFIPKSHDINNCLRLSSYTPLHLL